MNVESTIPRVGFWSALAACAASSAYGAAQILQVAGWVRPPWDAILIYGFSLCIASPFMIAALAMHYLTPQGKRFWSHAAVLFSAMYVTYVTLNYAVQLAIVLPGLSTDSVLNQTPHSLFWVVDALGYLNLGVATLFLVPTLERQGLQNWLRHFLLANAAVTPLIACVYFYPVFSVTLLYLGMPWIVTVPGSTLLMALHLKTLGAERARASESAASL